MEDLQHPQNPKIILLLAPPLCYTTYIVKGGEGNDGQEGDEEILQPLQMQGLLLKYRSSSFLRREGALILIKNNRKRGTGSKACFSRSPIEKLRDVFFGPCGATSRPRLGSLSG